MIYVPMLKTRSEEYEVLSHMSNCFSDKIIPLIEIISDKYNIRYKTDPITGEYVYDKEKKRKTRVKITPSVEDCITLEHINKVLSGKRVFIDYFRFSNEVYGNNIDISKVELSWKISNDVELYKNKLKEIAKYSDMIPVISIKKKFSMGKKEIQDFIQMMKSICNSIALRITEEWIEEYTDIINTLSKDDFFLLDIGEQNPRAKFMEILQVKEIGTDANVILLNSPRKRDTKNAEFPLHGVTDLINNCARKIVEEYEIDGYGDYCGIKDSLPQNGGSNGTGAALALLYNFEDNVFYSYCTQDTSLGMSGYKQLIPIIWSDRNILDPNRDCPGYIKIKVKKETGKPGNWATWHNINMTRYIYQTYKNL